MKTLEKMTALHLLKSQWVIGVIYRQTSNISHTLVDNKIADHSDVFGASPVGDSRLDTWLQWIGGPETNARPDEKHLSVGIWCVLYQMLPSGLFEFWGFVTGYKFDIGILFNDIEKK